MFQRRVITTVISLTLIAITSWVWLQGALRRPLSITDDSYILKVADGVGINFVAEQLVTRGVLSSALPVRVYARLSGVDGIQAGDYLLTEDDTARTLLDKLKTGDAHQYVLTFPEGWNLAQWRAALAQVNNISQDLADIDNTKLAEHLGIEQNNPEGWFAPDTYRYRSGDSDISILQRAHQRMLTQLALAWQEREENLPYKTPYEALVMASIIEKETGASDERHRIAGVFVRRLLKDMRLQTDPTVIYGLGDIYTGNLSRGHLQRSSPYNTYLIKGLPPTPITNPGLAALYAALHPEAGSEIFFVAKGDGYHIFSSSLEEHNEAVKKYQINNNANNYKSVP
jgi:UPF0755 protein